jgi:hypothetical protein
MAIYKPNLDNQIPLLLLIPSWKTVSGVRTKTYSNVADGELFYGSFKTYGGTERDINGVYSIEDTAIVETWFRPDITSDCRIALARTDVIYEIINEPENINQRSQFLKFKVKRIKGKA